MRKALVVLSGGQDSTTCLGIAMRECDEVIAITFDYGQKHDAELIAAQAISNFLNISVIVINLKPVLENMRSSALITHGDTTQKHPILKNLPASFVPARNALFLTAAYGIAIEHDCDVIYTGVCQTDYSGYPDCRDGFIKALNLALNVGYESEIEIKTPLMWLNKAQTFKLAEEVGVLNIVLNHTVTCYENDTTTEHEWGFGCGECPACKLRARGWEEYKAQPVEVLSDEVRNAH